jgi:hypothetical protein
MHKRPLPMHQARRCLAWCKRTGNPRDLDALVKEQIDAQRVQLIKRPGQGAGYT